MANHTTGAQRYNARMDKIWAAAKDAQTRFNLTSRNELEGMTQSKWEALSPAERDRIRDNSALTKQLIGLEGWRVEVLTMEGNTRRFYVGKSTGWRPCHLEIHNRRSMGGGPADSEYRQVNTLYRR